MTMTAIIQNDDSIEQGKQLYKQLVERGVTFYQRNHIDVYACTNDYVWDIMHPREITDLLLRMGIDPNQFFIRQIAYFTMRTIVQLFGQELNEQNIKLLPENGRGKVWKERKYYTPTYPWTYGEIRDRIKQGTL
jgi:hypothetical protein